MRSTQPQYFEKLERAEVILAVLTPAFYTSGPCLEEMTQALKYNLRIIPLLFELTPDGKAPWALGQWTAAFEKRTKEVEESNHSEAAEAKLEVITKTKKALGKLNSEPAPPGTMIEQGELLDKLVGTVKSLLPSYEIQRQAIEGVSVGLCVGRGVGEGTGSDVGVGIGGTVGAGTGERLGFGTGTRDGALKQYGVWSA